MRLYQGRAAGGGLDWKIPWKGLPALENLGSSSQEGPFPSIFGAKTPFLGAWISPPNPLPHQSCWNCAEKHLSSWECWGTDLDGQGDLVFNTNTWSCSSGHNCHQQDTFQGFIQVRIPGAQQLQGKEFGGAQYPIRGSSLLPTTVASPEEAHSQHSHTAAPGSTWLGRMRVGTGLEKFLSSSLSKEASMTPTSLLFLTVGKASQV